MQVKTSIEFVHRTDATNVGDFFSCPLNYYDFSKFQCKVYDIKKIKIKSSGLRSIFINSYGSKLELKKLFNKCKL